MWPLLRKTFVGEWWCFLFHTPFEVVKQYPPHVTKYRCPKCNLYYGVHHELRAVVPWDDELELIHEELAKHQETYMDMLAGRGYTDAKDDE